MGTVNGTAATYWPKSQNGLNIFKVRHYTIATDKLVLDLIVRDSVKTFSEPLWFQQNAITCGFTVAL